MSKGKKKGARVLVDAVVCRVGDGFVCVNRRSTDGPYPHDRLMTFGPGEEWLQDHPGVPVADLVAQRDAYLEELELQDEFFGYMGGNAFEARKKIGEGRIKELRAAREAAKGPKLQDGQVVWVRGKVKTARNNTVQFGDAGCSGCPGNGVDGGVYIEGIHPDDIRTEEP